jgi:hypothetical protein
MAKLEQKDLEYIYREIAAVMAPVKPVIRRLRKQLKRNDKLMDMILRKAIDKAVRPIFYGAEMAEEKKGREAKERRAQIKIVPPKE